MNTCRATVCSLSTSEWTDWLRFTHEDDLLVEGSEEGNDRDFDEVLQMLGMSTVSDEGCEIYGIRCTYLDNGGDGTELDTLGLLLIQ